MSRDITYFIASKGEGKTRWLLELAYKHQHEGCSVFVCCSRPEEFVDFCEKYFSLFGESCKAHSYTNIWNVTKNSVVLVDDLLDCNISNDDLKCLQINDIPIFVTLAGAKYGEPSVDTKTDSFQQLTFDI